MNSTKFAVHSKIAGWIVYLISFVPLLIIFCTITRSIKYYAFSWDTLQTLPWLLLWFFVLVFIAARILGSLIQIGYSFCIAGSLAFLSVCFGLASSMEMDKTFTLLHAWPLIVCFTILIIIGAVILYRAGKKEWKWWLGVFLPGIWLILLTLQFITVPPIVPLIIIWIGYICVNQVDIFTTRVSHLFKLVFLKLIWLCGFFGNALYLFLFYLDLSATRHFLKESIIGTINEEQLNVLPEIPTWLDADIRWTLIASILSLSSLLVIVFFEIFHERRSKHIHRE